MKKLFLFVMVIMIISMTGTVFAGGGKQTSGGGKGTIAWLLLGMNDWTIDYAAAGKKATEALGYRYVDYNCDGDAQKQLDHVQTCISSGVKAILIQPAGNAALAPAMKRAADAGIIVICHFEMEESLGLNNYKNVYFVVLGQYNCGLTVGKYFADNLPAGTKAGIIGGSAGADNNNQRKQGFRDAVAGKLNVVAEIDANWDRARAQAAAEDMMTQFPDLGAIYAVDDGMATGVAAAVAAAGKIGKVAVGGTGGDANGISLIKAGELFATCTAGCEWYATEGVNVFQKVASGQPVERLVMFMPEIMTKDNVNKF